MNDAATIDLKQFISVGFAHIDTQFGAINHRLDKLDTRMETLEIRVNALGARLDARIDALETKLEQYIEGITDMFVGYNMANEDQFNLFNKRITRLELARR